MRVREIDLVTELRGITHTHCASSAGRRRKGFTTPLPPQQRAQGGWGADDDRHARARSTATRKRALLPAPVRGLRRNIGKLACEPEREPTCQQNLVLAHVVSANPRDENTEPREHDLPEPPGRTCTPPWCVCPLSFREPVRDATLTASRHGGPVPAAPPARLTHPLSS